MLTCSTNDDHLRPHLESLQAFMRYPNEIQVKKQLLTSRRKCGGMAWFCSDPKVIEFVRLVVDKCNDMCNDQMIVNYLLSRDLNMTWDSDDDTSTALRVHSNNSRYDGLLQDWQKGCVRTDGASYQDMEQGFCFSG